MDPFQMALDALFNAPGSIAVVHRAVETAVATSIRGIRSQPTEDLEMGGSTIPVATNMLQIRRSEIPSPSEGDQLQIGTFASVPIGAPMFLIDGEPRLDVEGLTWSCEMAPS